MGGLCGAPGDPRVTNKVFPALSHGGQFWRDFEGSCPHIYLQYNDVRQHAVISSNARSHALLHYVKVRSQHRKTIFAYPPPNLALATCECEIWGGVYRGFGRGWEQDPWYTPPPTSHSQLASPRFGGGISGGPHSRLQNLMFPCSPQASKSQFPSFQGHTPPHRRLATCESSIRMSPNTPG